MDTIFIVFLKIGFLIILFLIGRELFCWYAKINKKIELMEEQNSLLEKIIELLSKENPANG